MSSRVPLARFFRSASAVEAGVDEAGRGALAGPVVAAAVVWNPLLDDPEVTQIRDSKRLTRAARERLRLYIEDNAVAWAVCEVGPAVIDRVNILNATFDAMHGALDKLELALDGVVVDGDRFRAYVSPVTCDFVPHACVIDGDDKYLAIAAASVLAKTHRDQLMRDVLHPQHPTYGWDHNVGYGSEDHMRVLRDSGPCSHHRMTFRPCRGAPT